ncbi:TlyA family rRNA (cytidine-2'-O)-methyltransferase [Rubrobacter tropicus]|uniref:TlyA family rRNA (Cytidine-2'-O)-methyltransferase n=1 Tax=Rubrobacter tropicus TaxID=2653851 RepID=A0A6G8Q959_9ACTN|nr:TlyA family RNA methyltransferase [Rubrobacter tropicus]QIN83024.1 TlyA family rRNA (cytidine-2'-O)-methyltransferase [Rubrobacter tropicus]
MKGTPQRLDALMVERGLAESRSRAQGLILSGAVRVGDEVVTKAGSRVFSDQALSVSGGDRFVSRAGEKLDAALDDFGIDLQGRSCLDAGASTGGFTDVLLQRGAGRVISADVGYGQLAWSLRNDPRVTVMERTNVRHLRGEDLPFDPDFLVADLSFISLTVALRMLLSTTPSLREAVVLVKPQFQAGPELVGRGGLVRDPEVRAGVILGTISDFAALDFGAVGVARAAVTGRRSGNQEYPLHLLRDEPGTLDEALVRKVVAGA